MERVAVTANDDFEVGAAQETPRRDLTLLAVAILLMLGGAATLVGEWIAAGIAIPLIAIGTALVVIARRDAHNQHVKRVPVP